ncbi:esterase/lipase family protein [Williamsia soli]|uniref:esterase/lipase family protein n=1 Tax=Williamsia soli TaxID=364929 RepID=UPI0027DCA150|nr:alpha/beta fold hydrolase [Williamsia soli]
MSSNVVGRLLGDAMTVPLRVGGMLGVRAKPGPRALRVDPGVENPAPALTEHDRRKVAYNFFSGIPFELRNPGGDLPGANEWHREPSADHPHPVILVHGTGGGAQTNWGTYVPLLANEGFSVFSLTYGAIAGVPWPLSAIGGMAKIEDSAKEFGVFVERVLEATGASQVDVVGHSQGTLMPNYWAKFLGGANLIRKYVSLAPMWQGTSAFSGVMHRINLPLGLDPTRILPCYSAAQMMSGSEFIAEMHADGGPYVPGIEYINISTRYDEFVAPYTSGQLPGGSDVAVTNIVVQENCSHDYSDHLAICGSQRAALHVLNALDDRADPRDVPCMFVPPFFGS